MSNNDQTHVCQKSFGECSNTPVKRHRATPAVARWRLPLLLLISSGVSGQIALADPSVDGNVISWPDDGWYQVQTADGATTICNGGSNCQVEEPGTYLVINHTTGERFIGIDVQNEGPSDESPTIISRDNHVELLRQVFSVYLGMIYGGESGREWLPARPETFMSLHVSAPVDVSGMRQEDGDYWGADNFRGFEMSRYECDNDGLLDNLRTDLYYASRNTYTWDNCLDGDTVKNGTIYSTNHIDGRHLISSDYTADYTNGNRMEISGNYGSTLRAPNSSPYDYTRSYWRTNRLNYSFQSETNSVNVRHADTEAKHFFTLYEESKADFLAMLQGSFQLNSTLTGNKNIDVKTTEALSAEVNGYYFRIEPMGYYPYWTFSSGVLELQAEDGSGLRLEADNGEDSSVQITLLQDGLELDVFQESWEPWSNTLNVIARDPRDW